MQSAVFDIPIAFCLFLTPRAPPPRGAFVINVTRLHDESLVIVVVVVAPQTDRQSDKVR